MGITNFCKLFNLLLSPTDLPHYYDCILVDIQSFLYTAVESNMEDKADKSLKQISYITWRLLKTHLFSILEYATCEFLTIIISFDGEGVPMKWPTQRKRRKHLTVKSHHERHRYALFGVNTIALQVQNYIQSHIQNFPLPNVIQNIQIVLSGCNVPGEGEHKVFQIAETLPTCRHPIVLSVDQDVFILAFLRLTSYESLQIHRYKQYYTIQDTLAYPLSRLVTASFLFGNDFIPTIVGITPQNAPSIHNCLSTWEGSDNEPAAFLAYVLSHLSLRYTKTDHVDRSLVVAFWTTYLWILDYYLKRAFPQLYLENTLFDQFNRNQLITALLDVDYSTDALCEARHLYSNLVTTRPVTGAELTVFPSESDVLEQLKPYWITAKNTACTVLHTTQRKPKQLKVYKKLKPSSGYQTPRKRLVGIETVQK